MDGSRHAWRQVELPSSASPALLAKYVTAPFNDEFNNQEKPLYEIPVPSHANPKSRAPLVLFATPAKEWRGTSRRIVVPGYLIPGSLEG